MFYKIKVDNNTQEKVFISKALGEIRKETKDVNSLISAGLKNAEVKVNIDENLENNCIKISEDVIKKLSIPEDILYGVIFKENEICLGPVIGLLVNNNDEKMTKENMENYINYTLLYKQFCGLIYVFSAKDIDFKTNTVKGYYYYESTDGYGTMWKKAALPLASVIYRRVGVEKSIRDKLIEVTNNKFFNSYYFDKLEFYDIVSSNPLIKEHIPETKQMKSLKDIDDMFLRHNDVFLKPVDGSKGIGQKKVTKRDGSFLIKGKFDEIPLKINSRGEVEAYIHKLACNNYYLVQQGIDSLSIDDRCSALRVIMQKNETLKWQCTTMIPYIGKKHGISSNYENYGYAMTFEDFFKKAASFNSKKIFLKKMEIIDICTKVCCAMDDDGGSFADVGIDVIVDKDLKVWILEVNKRHQHEFPLYLKDYQSYYAIKNNPIKYAVALCGFYV